MSRSIGEDEQGRRESRQPSIVEGNAGNFHPNFSFGASTIENLMTLSASHCSSSSNSFSAPRISSFNTSKRARSESFDIDIVSGRLSDSTAHQELPYKIDAIDLSTRDIQGVVDKLLEFLYFVSILT